MQELEQALSDLLGEIGDITKFEKTIDGISKQKDLSESIKIWCDAVSPLLKGVEYLHRIQRKLRAWQNVLLLICESSSQSSSDTYVKRVQRFLGDSATLGNPGLMQAVQILDLEGVDLTKKVSEEKYQDWLNQLPKQKAFPVLDFLCKKGLGLPHPVHEIAQSEKSFASFFKACCAPEMVSSDLLAFAYTFAWPEEKKDCEQLEEKLSTLLRAMPTPALKNKLFVVAIERNKPGAVAFLFWMGAKLEGLEEDDAGYPKIVTKIFAEFNVEMCQVLLQERVIDPNKAFYELPGKPALPYLLYLTMFGNGRLASHKPEEVLRILGYLMAAGVSVAQYLPEYLLPLIHQAHAKNELSTLLLLLVEAKQVLKLTDYQAIMPEIVAIEKKLDDFKDTVLGDEETPLCNKQALTETLKQLPHYHKSTQNDDALKDDFEAVIKVMKACASSDDIAVQVGALREVRAKLTENDQWMALLWQQYKVSVPRLENCFATILHVATLLEVPKAIFDVLLTDILPEQIAGMLSIKSNSYSVLQTAGKEGIKEPVEILASYFQGLPLLWDGLLSPFPFIHKDSPIDKLLYFAQAYPVPYGVLQAFRGPLDESAWVCRIQQFQAHRKPLIGISPAPEWTAKHPALLELMHCLQAPTSPSELKLLKEVFEEAIKDEPDRQAVLNAAILHAINCKLLSGLSFFLSMGVKVELDQKKEERWTIKLALSGVFKALNEPVIRVLLASNCLPLDYPAEAAGYQQIPRWLYCALFQVEGNMSSSNLTPILALFLAAGVPLRQHIPELLPRLIRRAHSDNVLHALFVLLIEAEQVELAMGAYEPIQEVLGVVRANIVHFHQAILNDQLDDFYAVHGIVLTEVHEKLAKIPHYDIPKGLPEDFREGESDMQADYDVVCALLTGCQCFQEPDAPSFQSLRAIKEKYETAGTWLAFLQQRRDDLKLSGKTYLGFTILHVAVLNDAPLAFFECIFEGMSDEEKRGLLSMENKRGGETLLYLAAGRPDAAMVGTLSTFFADAPLQWLDFFSHQRYKGNRTVLEKAFAPNRNVPESIRKALRASVPEAIWPVLVQRYAGTLSDRRRADGLLQKYAFVVRDQLEAPDVQDDAKVEAACSS